MTPEDAMKAMEKRQEELFTQVGAWCVFRRGFLRLIPYLYR